MRARERLRGGSSRAHLGQSRRSFSPAERYNGRGWSLARVAEIGGIGEIGLQCGRGRGKRRNQIIEDKTGQGVQNGMEAQLGLLGRIGRRVHVRFLLNHRENGMLVMADVIGAFPMFMEDICHQQNGIVQL